MAPTEPIFDAALHDFRESLLDLLKLAEGLGKLIPDATLAELVEFIQGAVTNKLHLTLLVKQLKTPEV